MPNLQKVGHSFLFHANLLTELDLPNLECAGRAFLGNANNLQKVNLPKLRKTNDGFLAESSMLLELQLPSLQITADDIKDYTHILWHVYNLKYLYLPNISSEIIEIFLKQNPILKNPYFAASDKFLATISANDEQNIEESKHTI